MRESRVMAQDQQLATGCASDDPTYDGVGLNIFDDLEFWDLEGLQAWAEIWAGKA